MLNMSGNVLILGNPALREKSLPVTDFSCSAEKSDFRRLIAELEEFRRQNGFGRGIAGIQIGIRKRIIALNFGDGPFIIVNPEIIERSAETFSMWDDCMSFPDLMVRVARNSSISIRYRDESGLQREWQRLDQQKSELLQHEIDHLDGILAVDRAIEKTDIIYKSEFLKNRTFYDRMVQYSIIPTL